MGQVAIITLEQREILRGIKYDGIQYFNVDAQDANGNYIIGEEEINNCTHEGGIEFIHSLPLINYQPPLSEI